MSVLKGPSRCSHFSSITTHWHDFRSSNDSLNHNFRSKAKSQLQPLDLRRKRRTAHEATQARSKIQQLSWSKTAPLKNNNHKLPTTNNYDDPRAEPRFSRLRPASNPSPNCEHYMSTTALPKLHNLQQGCVVSSYIPCWSISAPKADETWACSKTSRLCSFSAPKCIFSA